MPKTNLFALVGVDSPVSFDAAAFWAGVPEARKRKVPIGATASGGPVLHDLDGSILYLQGPQVSGKSELLRAVTLGLMLTHSPAELNFVLLDVTTDHTFVDLTSAPHVLTCLERDDVYGALGSRLQTALTGEVERRSAGAVGADLVIVVDGFSGMTQDWYQTLTWVAEMGRKVGVHVILGGQAEGPQMLMRTVSLTAPGVAVLDGTEFGPCFVSQQQDDLTLLQVAVGRMVGQGMPALDFVKPPPTRPLLSSLGTSAETLSGPIGISDDPYNGGYQVINAELSQLDGHAVVVGAHGSGKSTFLRTLVQALAAGRSWSEVQFYGLDFTHGELEKLLVLPHCRAMVSSADATLLGQVTNVLGELLTRRQAAFRKAGVHSVAEYRTYVEARGTVDAEPADVVVVIDGWTGAALNEYVRWHVIDFVNRGADFGVHVVLTVNRWSEMAPEFYGGFAAKFELQLTEPGTSMWSDYPAVRPTAPGECVNKPGRLFQVATPDLTEWPADGPAKIAQLPALVPYEQLGGANKRIPLGLVEGDHSVAYAGDYQHFLCFGGQESGRSSVVRAVLRGITESTEPTDTLIALIDYRRSNLGYLKSDHLLAYIPSRTAADDAIRDIVASLKKRLGAEHWSGPQLYLVIDDYELVRPYGSPDNDPLKPLLPLLPHAAQIGLHLVLAAPAGLHPRVKTALDENIPAAERTVLALDGATTTPLPVSGHVPLRLPVGRGVLSTPAGEQTIQVGWIPRD